MDLQQIKQLIRDKREKVIIVEDGKPVMVVQSYEGYQEAKQAPSQDSLNTANNAQDAPDIKEEIVDDSFPEVPFEPFPDQQQRPEEKAEQEMTLDDLPL